MMSVKQSTLSNPPPRRFRIGNRRGASLKIVKGWASPHRLVP